ncbi:MULTISPECIES: hypothetical protein [Pseudomonas]|uniref:Uncharacterized protein n=1 Tax=Pseudomonas auratipiscis TaxID=3115853 RepID=A0AB35WV07_9PSED|nr:MULTISPECIES: hypothetical protein [unclassified Pseudomonas]MEE1868277.1 hypothetical protein [Pseudomonas sp. 120P]MEE1957226.1 hypothetical protein [Pseudomonas sp. 119P]
MSLIKYALMAVLALGSGAALAEGGAERSKQFWEKFRLSQEQIHGDKDQAIAKFAAQKRENAQQQVAKE